MTFGKLVNYDLQLLPKRFLNNNGFGKIETRCYLYSKVSTAILIKIQETVLTTICISKSNILFV